MTTPTEIQTFYSTYAQQHVKVTPVDIQQYLPKDPSATEVNINEIWQFRLRVENGGAAASLRIKSVVLELRGVNGATVSNDPPEQHGSFVAGFVTNPFEIPARGTITIESPAPTQGPFFFRAPPVSSSELKPEQLVKIGVKSLLLDLPGTADQVGELSKRVLPTG